ncbi:MAG TPA: tetratricopeptide repeat protein, partial [Terriglobia bacterium]|nr:tetratricopeptide repeat protein [Terriglobia bacterium]
KNYILLRLDAPGKNPYRTIYHEYAHLILEDNFRSIPLWLNEGLAQFYANSDLDQKNVRLGLPSKNNLGLLRSNPLLPLKTLFAVTATSPYYNEENKGNIFYAESWALTDLLMFQKLENGKGPIDRYLALVAKGSGPVGAASEAFGNLQVLQTTLELFVHGAQFHYYRLKVESPIRESDLELANITPAESAAIRADFLLRAGRLEAGKSLLRQALQQDPQIPAANETMGLLELRKGHLQEAQTWFAKAASPQCYMARFYRAVAVMKRPSSSRLELNQAAQDLRDFSRFNPVFAPAYAALATLEASRLGDLDQAQQLAAKASQLDAHNVHYLFLEGEILLKMGNTTGALQAAQQAIHQAASPKDKSLAYVFLGNIQEKTQALRK